MDLFNKASEQLQGKVDFRHAYLDFSKLEVTIPKQGGGSEVVKTCPASMGFAFAAGTTDGPGAFDFKQGDDQVIIIGNSLTPKLLFLYMCSVISFRVDCLFYDLCQGNPFWRLVRNLLKNPNQTQIDCQHPKPILLDTGEMKLPYDWAVSCYSLILLGKPGQHMNWPQFL